MNPKLSGVFSAVATPVRPDLSADTDRLVRHGRQLLADGCHGLALLGSTGEANSFSVAERMDILEAVVAGGIAPERLAPGTGLCALPDTIALTRHALSLGVTTVVMLPPFYYKGLSDRALIESYRHVIEAVADPRLKIVLYHIPPIAQIPITFPVIEALLSQYGETVVGIKDSGGDLDHMVKLVETFPNLSVLAGADPLLLPLLGKGGAGCITATSNLAARELRAVFDGHADAAAATKVAAAQERIVALRTLSNRFTQIPTIKAMVAHRYGEADWGRVRLPFLALTEAQRAEIGQAMDEMDAGTR